MEKYERIAAARKLFPQGLPMKHLLDELVMPAAGEDPEKPTIARLPELIKPLGKYIEADFDNSFRWDEHHHRLPAKAFARFTTDEKLRACHSTVFCSDLKDEMAVDTRYSHFEKLRLALWHWGGYSRSYADFVRFYNGIRRFDFGIPGFETRFDHTSGCNERG